MNNLELWFLLCVMIPVLSSSLASAANLLNSEKADARDWGPWTGWSVCSETCGYGTAYRIRQCHVQHYRSRTISDCQGQSRQYKLCILKVTGTSSCSSLARSLNCSDTSSDYRTTECSKYNNVYYGQQTYTWISYINSVSPCELSCKSVGFGYYARFQKTVTDYVICNDENTAACIQGKCVKSGCDGILASDKQVDRCGVCGGDDTSCRLIRGIYTRTHLTHQGYNVITTIPAGAFSINITEMARSNNHLALSTRSGYFLNGDLRLQSESSVKGAGTTFNYSRSIDQNCPGECLTASGPLATELRVELIYFGRNPGIYYHFTMPLEDTRSVLSSMTLQNSKGSSDKIVHHQNDADISTSSADVISRLSHSRSSINLPGTVIKNIPPHQLHITSRVRSPKEQSHYQSRQLVTDTNDDKHRHNNLHKSSVSGVPSPQDGSSRVKQPQIRNENDIDNWLHEQDALLSPLPKKNQFYGTRENGSTEYKHYYHTNTHDNIGDIPMANPIYDDIKHADEIRKNIAPSWLPSNTPTRYAEFRSKIRDQAAARSSSHQEDIASFYRSQQEGDSRANSISNNKKYNGYDNQLVSHETNRHLYSWRILGFTTCSESCGGGLQQTRVVCVKGDSQVEVMEENCNRRIKPEPTTIVCNNQPCEPNWEVSEWDPCSVTCGRGLQKRAVECKQRISPTLTMSVTSSGCPQPQPQYRQYCLLDPCFKWRVSEWSKCTSECGFGQRTRTPSCVNSIGQFVNESLCSQVRPDVQEICDMGSCAQGWFHSKWSQECSSQCGTGFYTRYVFCSAADGSRLDEQKCGGAQNKPREHKACKVTRPCGGQWFTGSWSQCNNTCGSSAYRHRDVLCVKHHGKTINQVVKDHNCVKEDKPAHTELCGPLPACQPQWFVMSWSECSEACGTGVKTREVKCLDSSFTSSPDCNKDLKPSRRQSCNTQPCKDKHETVTQIPDSAENEAVQMDGSVSSKDNLNLTCKDNQSSRWCQLAKQSRLCHYPHYRKICCHTCRKLDPKHH